MEIESERVCVCVCVCERERERDPGHTSQRDIGGGREGLGP